MIVLQIPIHVSTLNMYFFIAILLLGVSLLFTVISLVIMHNFRNGNTEIKLLLLIQRKRVTDTCFNQSEVKKDDYSLSIIQLTIVCEILKEICQKQM